jgi:DNA-binding protein HU-beta
MADKFPKTKVQIIRALADKTGLTQAQVGSVLEQLAELAYAGAKQPGGFPVPGLGKVSMKQRKARTGFNPKTQEKIQIPAKTVVKFRLSKTAKDAILAK